MCHARLLNEASHSALREESCSPMARCCTEAAGQGRGNWKKHTPHSLLRLSLPDFSVCRSLLAIVTPDSRLLWLICLEGRGLGKGSGVD